MLPAYSKLELDKILSACSAFATLDGARENILSLTPSGDLAECRSRLALTRECDKLLYSYGAEKIPYFPIQNAVIIRASKGSALSCAELLDVAALLRSARICYDSVAATGDDITALKSLTSQIYYDENLEADISEKILSTEKVADTASEALFSIRSKIKSLNEKIRSTLSEYAAGKDSQYLQSSVVTIRNDRYVLPVKAENKNKVKGFVHDRSASGATFFIEPEYILSLNNELVSLSIDEKEEVERILKRLSSRVGGMCEKLLKDAEVLCMVDEFLAKAEYAYSIKAVCPQVNKRGYINIIKGRHPLLDKEKAVPVSIELGKSYSFLLLSGANTGGKTVTLKMVGLFCLMAECGLFIPAAEGSEVCAFSKIFCDVGDSQSIEGSLSTFSGHMTNIVDICNGADSDSLALIDELGGGTNPDEGQAIASAVAEHLLSVGAKGIITTHFTALKEYACTLCGMENAAMQFDNATLRPLYRVKIGMPGASNALAIARRLGLDEKILTRAKDFLSDSGRALDEVLTRAEETRVQAEETLAGAKTLEAEWLQKTEEAKKTLAALEKERATLLANAKVSSRKIINERTARAEELLAAIEEIFAKENLTEADLIEARTLKNQLADEAYEKGESSPSQGYIPARIENLRVGDKVYVESLSSLGELVSLRPQKDEAEVMCGGVRVRVKGSTLKIAPQSPAPKKADGNKKQNVKVVKKLAPTKPQMEINVIGLTVEEALAEVEDFLDKAILDNLEQVKIIHGVGTGKLRAAISARLKRHNGVKEFRSGQYGEGEIGVTIVTLR